MNGMVPHRYICEAICEAWSQPAVVEDRSQSNMNWLINTFCDAQEIGSMESEEPWLFRKSQTCESEDGAKAIYIESKHAVPGSL